MGQYVAMLPGGVGWSVCSPFTGGLVGVSRFAHLNGWGLVGVQV